MVAAQLEVFRHPEDVERRRAGRRRAENRHAGLQADVVAAGAELFGSTQVGQRIVRREARRLRQRHAEHAQRRRREQPRMDGAHLRRVVGERVPRAHARSAVAGDVPRQAGAWTEVVLVRVVQLVEAVRSELHQPAIGEEVRGQIVPLAHRREHFVAQSGAQRQPRAWPSSRR